MGILADMLQAITAADQPVRWLIGDGAWYAVHADFGGDLPNVAPEDVASGDGKTLFGFPIVRTHAFLGWELETVGQPAATVDRPSGNAGRPR